MPRWVEFNGQGATTGWVGWTDGHIQQGEVGLRSTLNETQGIVVDRQTATINHAKMGWVQWSGVGQTDAVKTAG